MPRIYADYTDFPVFRANPRNPRREIRLSVLMSEGPGSDAFPLLPVDTLAGHT